MALRGINRAAWMQRPLTPTLHQIVQADAWTPHKTEPSPAIEPESPRKKRHLPARKAKALRQAG